MLWLGKEQVSTEMLNGVGNPREATSNSWGFPEDPVESLRYLLFSKVKCWRTLESESTAQPPLHPMPPAHAACPLEHPGAGHWWHPSPGDTACISVCWRQHRRKQSLEGVQQKAERQMERAGRQLSVALAHAQEFFLLLSQISLIF